MTEKAKRTRAPNFTADEDKVLLGVRSFHNSASKYSTHLGLRGREDYARIEALERHYGTSEESSMGENYQGRKRQRKFLTNVVSEEILFPFHNKTLFLISHNRVLYFRTLYLTISPLFRILHASALSTAFVPVLEQWRKNTRATSWPAINPATVRLPKRPSLIRSRSFWEMERNTSQ
jgi:hypothetical protein